MTPSDRHELCGGGASSRGRTSVVGLPCQWSVHAMLFAQLIAADATSSDAIRGRGSVSSAAARSSHGRDLRSQNGSAHGSGRGADLRDDLEIPRAELSGRLAAVAGSARLQPRAALHRFAQRAEVIEHGVQARPVFGAVADDAPRLPETARADRIPSRPVSAARRSAWSRRRSPRSPARGRRDGLSPGGGLRAGQARRRSQRR